MIERIGILYPGHAAESDFAVLNERLAGTASFEVVHTSIGEDAHREDALLDMGSRERLLEGARRLPRGVSAVVWACTSGSFIYGWEGAQAQAAGVQDAIGVPVSSTSLAFVGAARALNLRRVAVAATYPEDITRRFEAFLRDAGLELVAASSRGIVTATEVGTLSPDDAEALVAAVDGSDADAVLVPDTALHTIAALEALEAAAGKPVLTANQVSAWEGLRLAGVGAAPHGLGHLFAAHATRS
ncbi:MAG: maleate cis-trans isomerase family protein [Solirubrobacteraceae bacterium]